MPGSEAVVFALTSLGEARKTAALANGGEGFVPPRQELVDVALVAYVKNEMVAGAVEHAVHGHRQLHGAQIGGEVAAGIRHMADNESPNLPAQLSPLAVGQRKQVFMSPDCR